MTITQFLALFHPIKDTKKGWDVCCPAHDDRHPSLGVMEGDDGRIVLNCLAGCTTKSICESLGLSLADLFQDRPLDSPVRPLIKSWKPVPPAKLAFAYELHALDLQMQADKILAASHQCMDCESWTNEDVDLALKAVHRAYVYQERAQFCESYADHLREQAYELKRLASG